jgi:hypothetical protein
VRNAPYRSRNRRWFAQIAEAINLQKGEQWEWSMEDKNTLIFSRVKKMEKSRRSAKA